MIDFRKIPFHQDDLKELLKLEIDFVFQPIFRSSDLTLRGYEALMRPVGKTPLELIDEYEKQNKLYVIELATCFGAALAYKKRGYTEKLCINSFPSEYLNKGQQQLYYQYFPEMMGNIIVEIVEYTKLDIKKWEEKQADIRKHRLKLSLDDFATGNNDMAAIEFFHPYYVKLDRSLVSNIQNDKKKQKRVHELISIFHQRNIAVIAEGIETEAELRYFRSCTDADYFQGYYLGIPA